MRRLVLRAVPNGYYEVIMIWKPPQQSDIMKMADWSAKNLRHITYLIIPIDDFGCRPQIICIRGEGQYLVLKRPVDSPTPKWIVSRYLPTTTRGLTNNSNNFEPLFLRYHIRSDPLEYSHLTPEFWSKHITLLGWVIVPDSKSNSSPSFGLFSWVTIAWHWVCDIVSVLYRKFKWKFHLRSNEINCLYDLRSLSSDWTRTSN